MLLVNLFTETIKPVFEGDKICRWGLHQFIMYILQSNNQWGEGGVIEVPMCTFRFYINLASSGCAKRFHRHYTGM